MKKTSGRPRGTYGQTTLAVVGIFKVLGPCTFRQALPLTGDLSPNAVSDACRSAVKHGLLTFDKSQRPGVYAAVSGSAI